MGVRPFLPAFYDFTRHQTTPFIMTVSLLVAAVSLLMNYLLWDETTEDEDEDRPEDEPLLSIKSLNGHALDIALLTPSNEGIVASAGLDRWIRIWNVRPGGAGYVVQDPESDIDPFPVLAMAIDSDSNWLAILSAKDMIALWNIPERRWGPTMKAAVKGRTPAAFFFIDSPTDLINPVVLVRHNGFMTEYHVESSENREIRICRTPLVCVRAYVEKANPLNTASHPRIITSSKSGCVHIATASESGWTSAEIPCDSDKDSAVLSVLPLPALSSFLAIRSRSVELIDTASNRVVHTFDATEQIAPGSLRCFHSARRRPQCGSVGVASLALAYTAVETGECVLRLYAPRHEGDTLCFRDPYAPGSKTCCLLSEAVVSTHSVANPGVWEALPSGHLVGIRRREAVLDSVEIPASASRRRASYQPLSGSGLRRRAGAGAGVGFDRHRQVDEEWEVWSIDARGERTTVPLSGSVDGTSHLLVGSPGPLERVGRRSLAVGLGNVIEMVSVGREKFEGGGDSGSEDGAGAFVGVVAASRRKRSNVGRKRGA